MIYNNQDKGISYQHRYRYPLLSAKVTCGMDPEQLAISTHFSEEGGQGKNENIRGFMENSTSRCLCRDCEFAQHRISKCKYTWLVQSVHACEGMLSRMI